MLSWSVADFLQKVDAGLCDLGFSHDFQSCGPCCPGVVASEEVLFWRRNVSVTTVGEFDHHVVLQWAGSFDLHARDGVGFVGCRRNSDISNTNGLSNDFGFLSVVKDYLLVCINFFAVFRETIAHIGNNLLSPLESLLIRHSILQRHPSFCHIHNGFGVVGNTLHCLHCQLRKTVRIVFDFQLGIPGLRVRVISSPNVTTTTMCHNADKVFTGVELLLEIIAKESEIVGTESTFPSKVMHGKVGHYSEWFTRCSLHRNEC